MLLSVSSVQVRRAALITVLFGGLLALTPLAALAAGTVTLAWDPSPATNAIASYNLYYGAGSATYTNVLAAGTNTTASVSNLVEGATYYFAATAVDTNGLESNYSTEVSTVIPVKLTNQPPTLNALASVTINESAGLQTVNLAGITSGATNEIQTLTVTASSSNPALIPTPAVNYTSPSTTGSITFTPVAFAYGSATITVTVNDGGTSNNVISRTFVVTVNPVNQAPTLTALANVTINESSGLRTVNLAGITSGAANEVQTLTVTAASSNPALIPTPAVNYTSPNATGSITFTPVALAYGSATITVTVNDGGTSNNVVSRAFTVTVNPVNQPPTLDPLAGFTLDGNAGLQAVNLTGISSGASNEAQTLTVTATSSNTGLIPTPTVIYTSPNVTGSIRFTPAPSASGSATITVTVNDGGASNNVVSRAFTVTVNPVNQPPTLSTITNQVIAMDSATAPIPFTIGDPETPAANLILSGSSDNATLVQTADIAFGGAGSNRTVTITPEPGQTGLANITLTVSDGTNTANSVFLLNVRQRPAAPGNLRVAGTGP
jgi:fibronectin type 3 domain-containing protein